MPNPDSTQRGAVTVGDLLAILALIAVCAGAIVPEAGERAARRRDALRLEDMERVQAAVELYRLDTGRLPPADGSPATGGWDVSHDGGFVPELLRAGYLREAQRDPLGNAAHHYRYRVHAPGSFGCSSPGEWYVLGLRAFESEYYERRHPGGFSCGRGDWSAELTWVTGGYADGPGSEERAATGSGRAGAE